MASATQDLDVFVRESLAQGQGREAIAAALEQAGWAPAQARAALAAYAEVPFAVPVPRPRAYLSAREAFFYLTLFTTLYLSAYHLGRLLFDLIEIAWPDPADRYGFGEMFRPSSLRWSAASLIIAFPVYLLMSRHLGKQLDAHPTKRLSAVRRWLTYLTLFVAAVVLIVDMIALVDNVLGGELTTRFVLKVLVAAVIAGGVFGYYLWTLRGEEKEA